jgi:excisionase family DNA binding protein
MKPQIADTPVGRIFTRVPPENCAGLGINDAGDYLGVGRTTIYDLLKKGFIKSIRVGSRNIVLRSSLDDYIHSLQSKSESGSR